MGMCQILQNPLGSVAVTGLTFWLTLLYLRTSVAGLAGGSTGKAWGVAEKLGAGGIVQLRTERILMLGAHSLQGCVGMYTIHTMLEGSCTETSTSPPGRSLNLQRRACWKGLPRRRSYNTCLMTWAWILNGMPPTCMVRNSTQPAVQLVAPLVPSISITCCVTPQWVYQTTTMFRRPLYPKEEYSSA